MVFFLKKKKYIYTVVIHRVFLYITIHQCGQTRKMFQSGIVTRLILRQSDILSQTYRQPQRNRKNYTYIYIYIYSTGFNINKYKPILRELILKPVLIDLNVGACGVMVIVVGNGHGDPSSNPGRDCLHFT